MKNCIKNLLAFSIALLFTVQFSFAGITTAIADGNWTSSATWNNGVPSDNDHVVIPSGITVSLGQTVDHINMIIENHGTLYFIGGSKLHLDANCAVYIVQPGIIQGSNNGAKIRIGNEYKWAGNDGPVNGNTAITNLSNPANSPNFQTPIPAGALLPVEFIYFNAETTSDQEVELSWATASEVNNDRFEVQRSTDAEQWETISNVIGAGTTNSRSTYTTTDDRPLTGTNYYRLKQVDIDGSFSFSKVVVIKHQNKVSTSVYPNPSSGRFNISFDNQMKEGSIVKIYNTRGQLVHEESVFSNHTAIDLTNQLDGMYAYHIEDRNNTVLSTGMIVKK